MIFVTVGTHTQGFDRLIKAVDNLVIAKKIREKVVIQVGNSKYLPKKCEWFRFTSFNNFIKLCKKSDLIITHGGVGSIIIPLKLRKPVIVVPRLKKFNEHINDHQLQIAKELQRQKKIIAVYDTAKLYDAMKRVRKLQSPKAEVENKILNIIEIFISGLGK